MNFELQIWLFINFVLPLVAGLWVSDGVHELLKRHPLVHSTRRDVCLMLIFQVSLQLGFWLNPVLSIIAGVEMYGFEIVLYLVAAVVAFVVVMLWRKPNGFHIVGTSESEARRVLSGVFDALAVPYRTASDGYHLTTHNFNLNIKESGRRAVTIRPVLPDGRASLNHQNLIHTIKRDTQAQFAAMYAANHKLFDVRPAQRRIIGGALLMTVCMMISFYNPNVLLTHLLGDDAASQLAEAESELRYNGTSYGRVRNLGKAATASIGIGDLPRADAYAAQLLAYYQSRDPQEREGWAMHYYLTVRGLLALHQGDTETAKKLLIESVTSPELKAKSYFRPQMTLARDLLERGEREIVLQYLESCAPDSVDKRKLAVWRMLIGWNLTPDFGHYLD